MTDEVPEGVMGHIEGGTVVTDSAEELVKSGRMPAIYVDRFLVAGGPLVLRIGFAEDVPGLGLTYRMAATMPLSAAKNLADAILETVEKGVVQAVAIKAANADAPK